MSGKRIVFTGIPDHQPRLLAMKNGDIDGTFDLAISEIDQWKALGNCDVITAPSLGVFVPNYYAVGHASLDNYIAMISGQAPNPRTEADCGGKFEDFTQTSTGPYEQAIGSGCVYPLAVQTLAGQLEGAGESWKG